MFLWGVLPVNYPQMPGFDFPLLLRSVISHAMSPLVTVLMPVHNGAAHLAAAMDSILSQTFRDFEFLIVDDASTDTSAAIVGGYTDPRIRLIPSRERLKLSGALNLGLDQACGTYIARMDADDISLPDRLAVQVRHMEQHPDLGLCGGWIRYFGAHGEVLRRPTTHETIRAYALLDNPFAHPTVMLRRDLLERHALRFNSDYFPTEDFELWTRAMLLFPVANIPRVLLRYRAHDASLTGSDWSTMDEQAVRIVHAQLAPLGLDPSQEALRFHRQLAMGRLEMTAETLDLAETWLTHLSDANERAGTFDRAALASVLGDVWFRACLHTARLGGWVTTRYISSPLGRAAGQTTRRRALLLLAALKGKVRS